MHVTNTVEIATTEKCTQYVSEDLKSWGGGVLTRTLTHFPRATLAPQYSSVLELPLIVTLCISILCLNYTCNSESKQKIKFCNQSKSLMQA